MRGLASLHLANVCFIAIGFDEGAMLSKFNVIKLQNFPSLLLLKLSLNWYRHCTRELLQRYRLLLVFLFALALPSVIVFKSILILPFINLLGKNLNFSSTVINLLLLQLAAIVWLSIQQDALKNRSWDKYLLSLPINRFQRLTSDTSLLVLMNSPFWLCLMVSAFTFIDQDHEKSPLTLILLIQMSSISSLLLLTQLCWLRRNYLMVVFSLSLCLVYALFFSKTTDHTMLITLLIISLFLCAFLLQFQVAFKKRPTNTKANYLRLVKKPLIFQLAHLQTKNLLVNQTGRNSLIATFLLASSSVFIIFLQYGKTSSYSQKIMAILFYLNVLIASNLVKIFCIERGSYLPKLSALPIPMCQFMLSDLIPVILLSFIINFIFMAIYFFQTQNYSVVLYFISSIALLFLLYYPQSRYNRYGLLISTIMVALLSTLIFLFK